MSESQRIQDFCRHLCVVYGWEYDSMWSKGRAALGRGGYNVQCARRERMVYALRSLRDAHGEQLWSWPEMAGALTGAGHSSFVEMSQRYEQRSAPVERTALILSARSEYELFVLGESTHGSEHTAGQEGSGAGCAKVGA
jgi:hypothetical protein